MSLFFLPLESRADSLRLPVTAVSPRSAAFHPAVAANQPIGRPEGEKNFSFVISPHFNKESCSALIKPSRLEQKLPVFDQD